MLYMTNIIFIPAGERGLRYKNTVYDNIMQRYGIFDTY